MLWLASPAIMIGTGWSTLKGQYDVVIKNHPLSSVERLITQD
jgi:hypothetical protein